jgi:hypothetical protein
MNGVISHATKEVDEIKRLPWGITGPSQGTQELGLRLLGLRQQTGAGADVLGHQLGELPQFKNAGVRVRAEIVLSERCPPKELGIDRLQELEVGALRLPPGHHGSIERRNLVDMQPASALAISIRRSLVAAPGPTSQMQEDRSCPRFSTAIARARGAGLMRRQLCGKMRGCSAADPSVL